VLPDKFLITALSLVTGLIGKSNYLSSNHALELDECRRAAERKRMIDRPVLISVNTDS
jgi:hypothetical protein